MSLMELGEDVILERRADEARDRLTHTLEALDHRRREVMRVGESVRKRAPGVVAYAVAATVGAVLAAAYVGHRIAMKASERSFHGRLLKALAGPPPPPSPLAEAGRRALAAAASVAATHLAKAVAARVEHHVSESPNLAPARPPEFAADHATEVEAGLQKTR